MNLARHRRVVAGLLAAAMVVTTAACSSDSDDDTDVAVEGPTTTAESAPRAEPLTIRFGDQPGASGYLAHHVAMDKGFFEEQGITIDPIELQGGGPAFLSALQAGDLDGILNTTFFFADAYQRGIKTKIVAAALRPFDAHLVVRKDVESPIAGEDGATWEDAIRAMEGKTVAQNALGGAGDKAFRWFMQEAGMDPDSITFVQIANPATITALQQKQVDAFGALTLGSTSAVLQQDVGYVAVKWYEDGPELYTGIQGSVSVLGEQFLEEHPDAAERYAAAIDAAREWMQDPANLDELVEVAIEHGYVDTPALPDQIEELIPLYTPLERESLEKSLEFSLAAGLITADVALTVDDLVAPGVIPGE